MAFSPNDKKDSDVEMIEANQASWHKILLLLRSHSSRGSVLFRTRWSDAVLRWNLAWQVPCLLCGSDSRSDVTLTPDSAALVLGPDVTPISISTLPASGPDVPCLLEKRRFGASTAMSRLARRVPLSRRIVVSEDAVEVMPPPPEKKRETVFGTSRVQRCSGHRGDVQELGLSGQRREKGVLGVRKARFRLDYRSIAPRLWIGGYTFVQGADSSRETLKRTEAVLQSIESTHAAQTSTLEARISDLERDLGKTVSSLLKTKEEKEEPSLRKFDV
ncbi:Uncharacterized protein Rs2_51681 [Raphanus sativus]|nr:Uncharacterized protein Rs2_51681 [Raphanus sativus]